MSCPMRLIPNLDALGRRYRAGGSIRSLARQSGIGYDALRRQIIHRGYHKVGTGQALGRDRGGFVRIPANDPLLARLRRVHPGVSA